MGCAASGPVEISKADLKEATEKHKKSRVFFSSPTVKEGELYCEHQEWGDTETLQTRNGSTGIKTAMRKLEWEEEVDVKAFRYFYLKPSAPNSERGEIQCDEKFDVGGHSMPYWFVFRVPGATKKIAQS